MWIFYFIPLFFRLTIKFFFIQFNFKYIHQNSFNWVFIYGNKIQVNTDFADDSTVCIQFQEFLLTPKPEEKLNVDASKKNELIRFGLSTHESISKFLYVRQKANTSTDFLQFSNEKKEKRNEKKNGKETVM